MSSFNMYVLNGRTASKSGAGIQSVSPDKQNSVTRNQIFQTWSIISPKLHASLLRSIYTRKTNSVQIRTTEPQYLVVGVFDSF